MIIHNFCYFMDTSTILFTLAKKILIDPIKKSYLRQFTMPLTFIFVFFLFNPPRAREKKLRSKFFLPASRTIHRYLIFNRRYSAPIQLFFSLHQSPNKKIPTYDSFFFLFFYYDFFVDCHRYNDCTRALL